MIKVEDKSKCCGCGACVQVCPTHCITFLSDNEGFFYPKVDAAKCIGCSLCERVCPELKSVETRAIGDIYVTQNPDEEVRAESSSGGVFGQFAERVISRGGVVFGARFDSDFNVVHDSATTLEQVAQFRTSKYVQSRIGNSYKRAEEYLKKGVEVLFTGTPCQILALKSFLRREYDNLTTIDFICHGVPSERVWQRHLGEVKCGLGCSEGYITSEVNFRDKSQGWSTFRSKINFSSGGEMRSYSKVYNQDSYMRLFLADYSLRPSCYDCPTKGGRSGSDVTIADCWGIHKLKDWKSDNRGTSIVLPHNSKADEVIGKNPHTRFPLKLLRKYNRNYFRSVSRPQRRDEFFEDFNRGVSLDVLASKYAIRDRGVKGLIGSLKRKLRLLLTKK